VRRGAAVRHTAIAPMSPWNTMGWVKSARQVLTRQNRRYRAAKRGDQRPVRRLQTLWLRSRAANLFAVRPVTPDHPGQQPPGGDGVAQLMPPARLDLVHHRHLGGHASPVRRVDMPKPGTTEPRPVGMPTLAARATPALVKHVLEPAWAAPCEPHSDGCRPGRRPGEAMGAIAVPINQQPTWVLDADIAQGGDRLDHAAL
jgi:RNA-directed DNA polymerase